MTAPDRPATRSPILWLCSAVSLAIGVAVAAIFQTSLWSLLLIALFLACPIVVITAWLLGQRPLPVDIGPAPVTRGLTMNWVAPWYDSLWSPAFGLGWRFRERVTQAARPRDGDRLLDAGCGTGWLTLRAASLVGDTGAAWGIDAAPDMIRVAMRNAQRAGVSANFRLAAIEALPFADDTFDVAVASMVIHHLPPDLKDKALRELFRVLRPDGRLLIVEPDAPANPLARLALLSCAWHPNMKRHCLGETADMVRSAGFERVTNAGRWMGFITFWRASKPSRADGGDARDTREEPTHGP